MVELGGNLVVKQRIEALIQFNLNFSIEKYIQVKYKIAIAKRTLESLRKIH